MSSEQKKSINNVKVDNDVHKKLKFLAIDLGMSPPEVVSYLLERVVDNFLEKTYTKNLKQKKSHLSDAATMEQ